MDQPLVSIIIPAYNGEEYIAETIDSCFCQTYPRLEVIVVDDGSTDETRKIIEPLINSGKIRYVYQKNQGPSVARNAGIRLAAGKYIQFLDADDLLLPEKIQKQVECLEAAPKSNLCACDFRCFDGSEAAALCGGDLFKGEFPLHSAGQLFDFETVIHRWLFPASLLRDFGLFAENLRTGEDWFLLWKFAARGTGFIYLDEPLALYRKHRRNTTNDFDRVAAGHLLAIGRVDRYQEQHGLSLYSKRDLDQLRDSYHYELGLYQARSNNLRRAWHNFFKALLLSRHRRQRKLLLILAMPLGGQRAIDLTRSANDHLWRWRARLRRIV